MAQIWGLARDLGKAAETHSRIMCTIVTRTDPVVVSFRGRRSGRGNSFEGDSNVLRLKIGWSVGSCIYEAERPTKVCRGSSLKNRSCAAYYENLTGPIMYVHCSAREFSSFRCSP